MNLNFIVYFSNTEFRICGKFQEYMYQDENVKLPIVQSLSSQQGQGLKP